MVNITHQIAASSDVKTVMDALTTLEGLKSWWTTDTTGEPGPGGTIKFRFNGNGMDMRVETVAETDVIWRCVSGPEEWLDTTIEFSLKSNTDDGTSIYFTHRNWAEESSFHYHCSMKWATFLLSLKEYLELGKGRAFPNDIQIEDTVIRKVS